MSVDIILAAFNGALYIEKQIDSILSQTYTDFTLYIRDDGSTDATLEIIKNITDHRVKILFDNVKCGSVGSNFKELLKNTTAEYVFFSDQDDFWLPNKIEITLDVLRKIRGPGLVYVNGVVVDNTLSSLNKNVYSASGCVTELNNILFLNGGVQGCAMAINRELIDLMNDDIIYWYMHDQVVSFYASLFGSIKFINKPLFLYRQHSNNVIGYKNSGYTKALIDIFKSSKSKSVLHEKSISFINSFFLSEKKKLTVEQFSLFSSFFCYLKSGKIKALYYIVSNNFSLKGSVVKLILKTIFFKRISDLK